MFASLYGKLAAVLVALLSLVGISALVLTSHSTTLYQQEVAQKLNRELAAHIVAEVGLLSDGKVNQAALENVFHQLMVFNPSIEIYLLDPTGQILAYSAPPGHVKRTRVDLQPIRAYLEGTVATPLFGDDPRGPARQKVFSAASVRSERGAEGFLYVILGGEEHDSILARVRDSHSLRQAGTVLGISLLAALAGGLLLFGWLTRRLRRLSTAMQAFDAGEMLTLSSPVETGQESASGEGDEIDRLSVSFRRMAARIQEQLEQLKRTDDLRRDLVANVSHDLRTPLATLQGYLETLELKEASLSQGERREYLDLALRHCHRLTRLVRDLFELARLDAVAAPPQREVFQLAELVQDVVQKMRLPAEQRRVALQADVSAAHLAVYADIGLVERALENLLENALRHTPEGGSVRVTLLPQDQSINVHVSDTGCGIAEADLPCIFDRFYQSDKSRSGGGGSSGLGLAIVKRIAELHGSVVQVRSSLEVGTTFSFSLPAAV